MARHITRALAATARAQDGALSTGEAMHGGLGRRQLSRLVDAGVLDRRQPGVFVAAGAPVTPMQRAWVAVLATGQPCALCGAWALWARRLLRQVPDGAPGVAVPHSRKLVRRDGVELRRVSWWPTAEVEELHSSGGIPVLSTIDSLVTAAPQVSDATLLAALQEAMFRSDLSITALIRRRRRGLEGSARLGRVVATYLRGHDSLFETTTYDVLTDGVHAGMHCNVVLVDAAGRRLGPVDGYHDDGAAYEADGREWHSRRRHVERDRRKDALAAEMRVPLSRFTPADVADGEQARQRWLAARAEARLARVRLTVEHLPRRGCPCGHRAAP